MTATTVESVAISPGGEFAVAGMGSGRIRVFGLEGTLRGVLEEAAGVRGVALSPDGRRLATLGQDSGIVRLWRLPELVEDLKLRQASGGGIGAVSLAGAGASLRIATLGSRGPIVWDPGSGRARGLVAPARCGSLALRPDGRWLAAGSGRCVFVWDLSTDRRKPAFEVVGRTGEEVLQVAFGLGGAFLAIRIFRAPGSRIRVVHLRPMRVMREFEGKWTAMAACDTRLAGGDARGRIAVWKLLCGTSVAGWRAHRRRTNALAFGDDGRRLLSGAADGSVALWHVENATPSWRLELAGLS